MALFLALNRNLLSQMLVFSNDAGFVHLLRYFCGRTDNINYFTTPFYVSRAKSVTINKVHILTDKAEFVRRRLDEKYKDGCIVKRVKHPLSIMVWSVISSQGTGRPYIVEGTMRQEQYIKVLVNKMLPQTHDWFPDGGFTYMHDFAPCHKAKKSQSLSKNTKLEFLTGLGILRISIRLRTCGNWWNGKFLKKILQIKHS